MNKIHKDFLSLVRAGLWGTTPDPEMFGSNVDWQSIYDLSKQQALLGIVLDGVNLLPENIRPPRMLYIKWCAEVLEIEDENHRLDKEILNIYKLLRENNIEPVLMKGQGIARNYRFPEHRSSGDIDIFVGRKDYDKVNGLFAREGKSPEKWEPRHRLFEWHNVIVENHKILAVMNSPFKSSRLQQIVKKWHEDGDNEKIEFEGIEISLPPLDFDVVFILLHSVTHLLEEGLGLRQVCDWANLLHNKRERINRKKVVSLLKELNLITPARVFGALSVIYLGLPEEDLIIPYNKQDIKAAEILLDDIWYNGNFGFSGERIKKRPGGWLTERLYNMSNNIKRTNHLRKIAPSEALWGPYKRLSNSVMSRWDKHHINT